MDLLTEDAWQARLKKHHKLLDEEDLRARNDAVTRYSKKDSGITINVESGRV
jgi:hypothetical protein